MTVLFSLNDNSLQSFIHIHILSNQSKIGLLTLVDTKLSRGKETQSLYPLIDIVNDVMFVLYYKRYAMQSVEIFKYF